MKHTMVRYKSERCPCGKPISTHTFPEYQRHLAQQEAAKAASQEREKRVRADIAG